MALINCSNCGQSVSDKATVCPHCGFVFPDYMHNNPNLKKCDDCGAEYDITSSACPQCGCPNMASPTVETKKNKHTGLKISLILAALLIVFIIGFVANKKIESAKYYNNMKSVSNLMLDGAADAETAGNLIISVWHNAIYEKRDSKTDKYTIVNKRFVDDFNVALSNLFEDKKFAKSISKIKDNQEEVTALMKQLKNPPKEYKEAYVVLNTYYENYLKMTKMVINPTGSLRSFSDDFNDIDTETANDFDKIKLYLD